ncbi:hypothetical protein GCM10023310_09110 [Paenibacillus vulneris]|uniref:MFS transporter n=1 Tax=Paenibacillus vulneris TaxID=1133364 RepID=A0ABW3UXS5_9BACL
MQYIIFGIIAVVGLIFLIVYNLKVEANRKKKEAEMETPARVEVAPPAAVPSAAPPAEPEREPVKEVPAAAESLPSEPKVQKQSNRGDYDYRQALRNFESGEEQDEDQQHLPPKATGDNQFRDALRSLNKQDH